MAEWCSCRLDCKWVQIHEETLAGSDGIGKYIMFRFVLQRIIFAALVSSAKVMHSMFRFALMKFQHCVV